MTVLIVDTKFATQPVCNAAQAAHAHCSDHWVKINVLKRPMSILLASERR